MTQIGEQLGHQESKEPEFYSLFDFFGDVWEKVCSASRIWVILPLYCLVVFVVAYISNAGWISYVFAAVGTPVVFVALAIVALVVAMVGEAIADGFSSILRLSPNSKIHRVIYFLLSIIGFVLAAFFIPLDGDGRFGGRF